MGIITTQHSSLSSTINDGLLAGCISDRTDEGLLIVSKVSTVEPIRVLNYDLSGDVGSITDRTAEASSTSGSTFQFYNSNNDSLRIEITDKSIRGLNIDIITAGLMTGTPVITASYVNTSGVNVEMPVTLSGDFNSINIIDLEHDEVFLTNIMSLPVSAEPGSAFGKYIDYKITGLDSITTAPTAEHIKLHLGNSSSHEYKNFTSLLQTGGVYSQEVKDIMIAPTVGDMTIIGLNEKTAKIFWNLYRGTNSTSAKTKRIYSTSTGFNDLPAENIILSQTSDVLFNDQGKTVYDGTADELIDVIEPPEDWVQKTIEIEGQSYTKYWIGFEYTETALASWKITLGTVKTQPIHGDNVTGISQISKETSCSNMKVIAENPGASKILMSNIRTGQSAVASILDSSVNKTINFTSQLSTDEYLFQVLEDEGLNSPSLVTMLLN